LYERTVLTALGETENALVEFGRNQARGNLPAASALQSEKAALHARQRFKEGVADFLTVLDAKRTLLEAQDYKALGGEWEIATRGVQTAKHADLK
jgi:outer membrane protein, multidrug efflux system